MLGRLRALYIVTSKYTHGFGKNNVWMELDYLVDILVSEIGLNPEYDVAYDLIFDFIMRDSDITKEEVYIMLKDMRYDV
jgi:hypothetical protein